ncbi:MAG: hypothetical protein K8S15_09535 [Candidatus Aegiribacteria sp.]|nr:hypothetical protein [Candidatus Aegiribacteria sp.]
MYSGNDSRNDLKRTPFPIAVVASILVLLLPFVLVPPFDSPVLTGIPYSQSQVLEDSVWIFCNGGAP